jgi:alpha-tubulin suppressor-like RCC1 family protein
MAQVKGPAGMDWLSGVVDVSAGAFHSLALTSDGSVWAWGLNDFGELGDGTRTRRDTPVPVSGPGGVGRLTNVQTIAAGNAFSLALLNDGSVLAWGFNSRGQLGDATTTSSSVPVRVRGMGGIGFLTGVRAISASPGVTFSASGGPSCLAGNSMATGGHSLALLAGGTVMAWGANDLGQLGDGTLVDRATPVGSVVPGTVIDIAAGARHSLAVNTSGQVWTWGVNDRRQLGTTPASACLTTSGLTFPCSTRAVQAQAPGGMVAVAAGSEHSLALALDGNVWAWGANELGQLGDNTTVLMRTNAVRVFGLSGAVAIDAGFQHSVAVVGTSPMTWGANGSGQLGRSTSLCSGVPCSRRAVMAASADFARVEAGGDFTLAVGRGALSISPTTIEFGSLPAGSASAPSRVSIVNRGWGPVTISAITAIGSEFTHTTTCPAMLPMGSSCAVDIVFRPPGEGSFGGSIFVEHNASPHPQQIVLMGQGLGPKVAFDRTSLDFGPQRLERPSQEQTVRLTNAGQAPLTVAAVTTGTFDFAVTRNTCAAGVAPQATCELGVTFTPSAAGLLTDTLFVSTNAGGTHNIALKGTGALPAISLSPAGITFGSQAVGATSPPRSVTLANTGTVPLEVASISGSVEFPLLAASGTCPVGAGTLTPGSSCTVAVAFAPAAGGARQGELRIEDDAPGSPHSVLLLGSGVYQPAIAFRPSPLQFGDQPQGTSSAARTVTITNSGSADLAITTVGLTGTNAADFALGPEMCSGATLRPEMTCTASVTFRPGSTGPRAALLTFADNALGSPHSVSLEGNGTPRPPIVLDPGSVDFGTQAVGGAGAVHTVTLTNETGATTWIETVELGGADAGQFTIDDDQCSGVKLADGAACTVDVRFSPGSPGSRRADLSFTTGTVAGPHVVALAGVGLGPAIAFDPPGLSFGDQPVGSLSPEPLYLTVRNAGTALLTISGIVISGDFVQSNFCATLAPGGFCVITVRFQPSAPGLRSGQLTVTSDAPGSPHTIPLSGTGT